MDDRVVLCIDEPTSRNFGLVGLEGESFEAQPWLAVFSNGDEARRSVIGGGATEAWVVSCEDVEPINLAAAIKADRPDMRVSLISFDTCGSLLSRAHTADIDEVIEWDAFVRRYVDAKRRYRDSSGEAELARQPFEAPASIALAAPPTALDHPRLLTQTAQFACSQTHVQPASIPSGTRAFMVTVVSGSGGVGKSAVSMLGALAAKEMGHRTLLLDCDLQFGDVAFMAGIEDPLRIDTAMTRLELVERELARDKGLTVIAAPDRLEAAEEVVLGLPDFLERMSGMFDVIVANTGAAWAEQHATLLERSSAALFLVDQRVSSVRSCQHALDLCSRCGIATGPFQFALNRCAKGAPLTSVDVSCALQGAPVFELKDGGRDVEDYLSGGAASDLFGEKGEFARSVEHVMERVLPGIASPPVERPAVEADHRVTRRRGRHANRKRGWRRS